MWFLETMSNVPSAGFNNSAFGDGFVGAMLGGGIMGALIGLALGMLVVVLVILAGLYVYTSLAFMAIGRKAKLSSPGLAWIPLVGPLLISSQAAEMHWWPILLLLVGWVPWVGQIGSLVLMVFSIIWMWKTFENIDKPGWWAILLIIPIVNLVMIGIAAWSRD